MQTRLKTFRGQKHRYHALRRCGVDTAAMVQAAGAAAMPYSVEVQGIADTLLHQVRSAAASAAAPEGAGKNVDRTLYAVDGCRGTIDPAFNAHCLPILAWATALWEGWYPDVLVEASYHHAVARVDALKKPWSYVGPVGGTIMTARRLGWSWTGHATLTDDTGREWDLKRDPPAALKKAITQAVRRWRLRRIGRDLPGLVPLVSDIGAGSQPKRPFTKAI